MSLSFNLWVYSKTCHSTSRLKTLSLLDSAVNVQQNTCHISTTTEMCHYPTS